MQQLRNTLRGHSPKVLKYFTFKYGGHNDTPIRGGKEYWESFCKFMDLVGSSEEERRRGIDAWDRGAGDGR